MQTVKMVFGRNLFLYLVLGLIVSGSVDWQKCFHQRGKYLLGIFYNGYFQNDNDGAVYKEFLKRHNSSHDAFIQTL